MAVGMGDKIKRQRLKQALGRASEGSGCWSKRRAEKWKGVFQKALNRCGDPEYVWFVEICGDRMSHYLKIFRQKRLKKGGLGPLQLWEVVWDKLACEHNWPLEVLYKAMGLPPYPDKKPKKRRKRKRR